jgi:hypothetical protein
LFWVSNPSLEFVEAPAIQPPEVHIPESQRERIEKEQEEIAKHPLPPAEDEPNESDEK